VILSNPDYTLTSDGGVKKNGSPDSYAYGSYHLKTRQGKERTVRLDFPNAHLTSNEAEYDTLLIGIEELSILIKKAGKETGQYSICVCLDSKLVVRQVTGKWKTKATNLKPRQAKAQNLLEAFLAYQIEWRPRREVVKLLGH
jgi:ribonuclease HI